jgi:hypothetical protein
MANFVVDLFSIVSGFGILAALVLIYIYPWLAARRRSHPDASAIGILNLFLGWTFLGWVVALVWAYKTHASRGTVSP